MGDEPVILMCVGATKAGTTWLHDQLSAHPECYLRTIKEYHYFSTNADAQWAKMIADTRSEIAEISALPAAARSAYQVRRLDDLASYLPLITPRSIDATRFANYLRASAPSSAKLVGDFTPAYSVIAGKNLEPMLNMRALKVVYLIRDPLARLWSHIRMTADRAAPDAFAQTCEDLVQRTVLGQEEGGIRGIVRRGDYAGNLPKLQRIFGDKLLVMFTEDLFTKAGFDRLLGFLGLGSMPADMAKRVHEGRALPMPAALRAAALRFLRPQYDYIAQTFPALPQAWRDAMAEMNTAPTAQKVLI
ncbi:MAG: sulfotransferase [Cypionkella sp.]|nr:sulfotransferase [Cypionkella sp.]